MMGSHKLKQFCNALEVLHNELEINLLQNCQRILKEIVNAEKISLLNKIHSLVEQDLDESIIGHSDAPHFQNRQEFRCDSCKKHFPLVKSESESVMSYEVAAEYGSTRDENQRFFESDDCLLRQQQFIPIPVMPVEETIENPEIPYFKPPEFMFDPISLQGDGRLTYPNVCGDEVMVTDNTTNSYRVQTGNNSTEFNGSAALPTSSNGIESQRKSKTSSPKNRNKQSTQKMSTNKLHHSNDNGDFVATSVSGSGKAKSVHRRNKSNCHESHSHDSQRPRPPRISCPHCGVMVATTWVLKRHIRRIHTKEAQNFQCALCRKQYSSQDHLSRHIGKCNSRQLNQIANNFDANNVKKQEHHVVSPSP